MTADDVEAPGDEVDGRRVVAIGGGHGLSRTLTAMRICGWRPTAVVSVADDGGSSGRLRSDLGVSPPGDLRRALSTLCPDPVRRSLLEYRFDRGDLEGHALGNLVLLGGAALRDGDMAAGLAMLGDLFGARGEVVPVCDEPVHLEATLHDGTVVRGQKLLTTTPGAREVRLVPAHAAANAVAVAAIEAAELVVIGPGSLFTSLVPPLLTDGIAAALRATAATTVMVANVRQQPGETEGLDMVGHLDAFFRHLPGDVDLDVLVVNEATLDPAALAGKLPLDAIASHPRVGRVVRARLADDQAAHDAAALADVLHRL